MWPSMCLKTMRPACTAKSNEGNAARLCLRHSQSHRRPRLRIDIVQAGLFVPKGRNGYGK